MGSTRIEKRLYYRSGPTVVSNFPIDRVTRGRRVAQRLRGRLLEPLGTDDHVFLSVESRCMWTLKSSGGLLLLATGVLVGCTSSEKELADSSQPSSSSEAPEASESELQPSISPIPAPLDEGEFEARRSAVKAEIDQLGPQHPWAGVYRRFGVDAGTTLMVAPQSGYVKAYSVLSRESARSYGTARYGAGTLLLEPEFPLTGSASKPIELIHVTWGDLQVLLTEFDMAPFCNAVNGGWEEANPGRAFLVRNLGAERRGVPELPEQYRAWIHEQPIESTVLELPLPTNTNPFVVLDVGARDGVFKGMKLYNVVPDRQSLPVVVVNESTCGTNTDVKYAAELQIGARFTTRRPRP